MRPRVRRRFDFVRYGFVTTAPDRRRSLSRQGIRKQQPHALSGNASVKNMQTEHVCRLHCVLKNPGRRNVMTSFTIKENAARAGITVAVALFTCLLANGARAEQPQLVKVTVSYADLDLSKPAGAQTLYKRIKAAAQRVCARNDNYSI